MKTFVKYYKHILVLWFTVGIGLTGFFYIYPEHVMERQHTRHLQYVKRIIYTKSKLSFLYTMVGSIIIGGFGFIESNRQTKS